MVGVFQVGGFQVGQRVWFPAWQVAPDEPSEHIEYSEGVIWAFHRLHDDYLVEIALLFEQRRQYRWLDEIQELP